MAQGSFSRGASHCTYAVRVPAPAVPYVPRTVAPQVSLKYGLLWALLQGSVYHFPTSHYVNPVRCASRSFDCYFEPPSNCTRPTATTAAIAGGKGGKGGKGGGRRGRQLGQRSPAELRRRRPWLAATTGSNRSQHRAAEEVTNHACCNPMRPGCNPRCPGCSPRCPARRPTCRR